MAGGCRRRPELVQLRGRNKWALVELVGPGNANTGYPDTRVAGADPASGARPLSQSTLLWEAADRALFSPAGDPA